MVFTVETWTEVHRDPGGHGHHWTIALGTLDRGTIAFADCVVFRARDGRQLSSRVLGVAGREILALPIAASDLRGRRLALCLWAPAYGDHLLAGGQQLIGCDESTHRAITRDLVLGGWPWCPCSDCCKALRPLLGDDPALWSSVHWLHPAGD
ncbi:MAG TPA: hypothetical protein VNO33_16775 [Kofleriaceae bacterium]|nr:hypothetical protein [Kofleriaceae bacterium]